MKGVVLYSDGGARPTNPGYAGCGVHGYIYEAINPNKGIGLGSTVTSSMGYVDKVNTLVIESGDTQITGSDLCSKSYRVTPIRYIDSVHPIGFGSNNLAELFGALMCLRYIAKVKDEYPDIVAAVINTDSELTVKGINQYLPNWINNEFRKDDGTIRPNHNVWLEISKALKLVSDVGVSVTVNWVKAHDGEHGNEKAGSLATLAVYQSYRNQHEHHTEIKPIISDPDGYWKSDIELHPFFQHRCIYFNTGEGYHQPGQYNTGNHGKDDDLLGNRRSDGCYSHIRLNEPESIFEDIISFASQICSKTDNIWIGYINRISAPATREAISVHGYNSIDPIGESHIGYRAIGSGKEPIVRMQKPPQLAHRAIREVCTLSEILDDFLSQNTSSLTVNDVTDKIYDSEVTKNKKDVETTKIIIKPSLVVGISKITLPVKYRLLTANGDLGDLCEREISFTCGVDILNRNGLKRIECLNPKIYTVSWSESSDSFRYATIVKVDGGVGIWGGVYSNLYFVPPSEKKKTKTLS